MSGIKLLTNRDLVLEFKGNTGRYVFLDELEETERMYVKNLEDQLLEYKNAELVIREANIEATTIMMTEKEECIGCENCTCNE